MPEVSQPTFIQGTLFNMDDYVSSAPRRPLIDRTGQGYFNFSDDFEKSFRRDQFIGKVKDTAKSSWANTRFPQRMMLIGGAIGLFNTLFNSSEKGIFGKIFSLATDVLSLAAVFNPALLLPAVGLMFARGAWTLLNGGTFAGLLEMGLAFLPGVRGLGQLGKIISKGCDSGIGHAFELFIRNGFGRTAQQQVRAVGQFVSSPLTQAKGLAQGAGSYYQGAVDAFRAGREARTAASNAAAFNALFA